MTTETDPRPRSLRSRLLDRAAAARESASEVLASEGDNRGEDASQSLPRHRHARSGKRVVPRQPALWGQRETVDFDEIAVWGAYPRGFVAWAARVLRTAPDRLLHVCSGSLAGGRARVDIRREASPDVVADGRRLPFRDGAFEAALIDPPYTREYARDLYGTEYPRPSHLLREAARVVQPCGRIGFLHFLVVNPPDGCTLESVHGITTGTGYRIRAFTVFARDQDALL